jgi:hypothetical protein
MKPQSYGVMAEFASERAFLSAVEKLRKEGFLRVETFTPYRVEGLDESFPGRTSPVPWIMLFAGIIGGAGAYFMQWYACRDYPLNVGGRPLNSWPSYVPITFELTVLTAALVGVGAMLWLNGLPRLDHPAFADRRFLRASQDRFFICIRAEDPLYPKESPAEAFRGSVPDSIAEVLR